MTSLAIRDATAVDAEAVVGWFDDREAALKWGGPYVPEPLTADWLVGEIAAGQTWYRTAVAPGGTVIGFYGVRLAPVRTRARLVRIASAPKARGRGVGTALLQDAIGRARAAGLEHLTLYVYGSNQGAQRLYERLGWRIVERAEALEDESGFKWSMEITL